MTKSQARLTTEKLAELKDVPGFAAAFLPDGKPPQAGATLKQTALAATFDHLAHAGLGDFYRGDVGRELAADLEKIGSPVTRDDVLRYRPVLAEPLSVKLDAGTVYNTPPPTQGLASLIILGLYEQLGVKAPETFEFAHGLVEVTKRAFRIRDRVVTDPARLPQPRRTLSRSGVARRRIAEDRLAQGREMAGAARRGRHHLDGRGRRFGSRGVLHPVALLGVRLGLRAAAHRRC